MKRAVAGVTAGLILWLVSGVYFVEPDEIVLVRRCGRLLTTPREPGAHFGFPVGIDEVERLRPREMKRVSVGRTMLVGEATGQSVVSYVTADRNLVNVRATVQYTISDPHQYVRQAQVVDSLIAIAAEACLGNVLAGQGIDRVLTQGKNEVAVLAREQLAAALNDYQLGVLVRSVELASLEPPLEVAPAFAAVITAQRLREQTINEAHSAATQIIESARSGAQQLTNEALADREKTISEATGEADRFERLLVEYRRSPQLTAQRLYLEGLSETLPRLKSKLVLDRGQQLDLGVFGEAPEKP